MLVRMAGTQDQVALGHWFCKHILLLISFTPVKKLARGGVQVYMLEKRMLDPRRPVGPPSKDDQLEGLMPYQSSLPISPLLYATHSKQVAQLSGLSPSQGSKLLHNCLHIADVFKLHQHVLAYAMMLMKTLHVWFPCHA